MRKPQYHPVDIHVGGRLRQRRVDRDMSQEKLGNAVGLTFQQIQKYERGTNRISASRLYEFAGKLGVDVGYFFAEMPAVLRHRRSAGRRAGVR
ncbi:MAG: helix-turn-helix domain-containing protein [Reyranella sp.]|nr:helix-turn-helix domain-containing protein [Reyranella sp.]